MQFPDTATVHVVPKKPRIATTWTRSQINLTLQTDEGGIKGQRGRYVDFIVPVKNMHSWFRESTWQEIARVGRKAGRPTLDNVAILSSVTTHHNGREFDAFVCDLMPLSHPVLVGLGGFNGDNQDLLILNGGLANQIIDTQADTVIQNWRAEQVGIVSMGL